MSTVQDPYQEFKGEKSLVETPFASDLSQTGFKTNRRLISLLKVSWSNYLHRLSLKYVCHEAEPRCRQHINKTNLLKKESKQDRTEKSPWGWKQEHNITGPNETFN